MNDINNASQFPRIFYCRHMQPGIAKYDDETILVDTDGMKNLIASATKRSLPVYINHQPVDLKNIKQDADGYVCDSFYNELDGWAWFKFIAVDDKAHEAIKKGWAVSNAYLPTEFSGGGTKNNCVYNREVRAGEFTHLAIVPNPRYEGAMIMSPEEFKNYQETQQRKLTELKNSTTKGISIMKLFNFKKEETTTVTEDTMAELPDGSIVKVSEMINAVAKKEVPTFNVGGKKMTQEQLIAAYVKLNAKKKTKNSKPEDEDDAEGEEEEVRKEDEEEGEDEIGDDKKGERKNKKSMKNKKEKKNEDDMEEEAMENEEEEEDCAPMKKNKKEKKNAISDKDIDDKFFHELRNANSRRIENARPLIEVSMSQIERGKARYGSSALGKK